MLGAPDALGNAQSSEGPHMNGNRECSSKPRHQRALWRPSPSLSRVPNLSLGASSLLTIRQEAHFTDEQTKAPRVKQLASIRTAGQWLSWKSDLAIWHKVCVCNP